MMESKKVINGIEIDEKRAKRMLSKLILREKTNIKTKEFNDGQNKL